MLQLPLNCLWSSQNSTQTQSSLQTATRRVPLKQDMVWQVAFQRQRLGNIQLFPASAGWDRAKLETHSRPGYCFFPALSPRLLFCCHLTRRELQVTCSLSSLTCSYFRLILPRTDCWPLWQNQISQYQFLHHPYFSIRATLKFYVFVWLFLPSIFPIIVPRGPGTVPSKQKAFKQYLLNDLCRNYCLT